MTPKQFKDLLKAELKPILEIVQEDSRILKEHSGILKEHSGILKEHSGILKEHSGILKEHTKKIDALMSELYEVHKLAEATADIVKARYEKNKREIDEIKDHLDLPKKPYFGN